MVLWGVRHGRGERVHDLSVVWISGPAFATPLVRSRPRGGFISLLRPVGDHARLNQVLYVSLRQPGHLPQELHVVLSQCRHETQSDRRPRLRAERATSIHAGPNAGSVVVGEHFQVATFLQVGVGDQVRGREYGSSGNAVGLEQMHQFLVVVRGSPLAEVRVELLSMLPAAAGWHAMRRSMGFQSRRPSASARMVSFAATSRATG